MAQVPYAPVPQVTPSNQALPNLNIDTPADAFGAGIAEAFGHLGKVVEHSATELWNRAKAMQMLKNEADAREADTEFMVRAGDLHAKYNALQGKEAVDARPAYVENLTKARDEIKGMLSNPHARKLYDAQTQGVLGRHIFNSAGHAATELKQYSIQTAEANVNLAAKTVEDSPRDRGLMEQKLAEVRPLAEQTAEMKFGAKPGTPIVEDYVKKAESKVVSQWLEGLAREAPAEAMKEYEANKHRLYGADQPRVENLIRSQGRAVESRNIAEEVYVANPDMTQAEQIKLVRKKANEFNPKDPVLAHHAEQALISKWTQTKQAERIERYANEEIIETAINRGVKNIQELRADPRVAAAIDAMPAAKQNDLPARINRVNAAADKLTNDETALRLNGMRLSPDTVADFIALDLSKEQLSKQDMEKFQGYQAQLRKNAEGDPRVNRAIQQLKAAMPAQLKALDVYSLNKGKNDDDYLRYVGALHSAIDVWTEAHGKAPGYKDIVEEIGPQVIKQSVKPAHWLVPGTGEWGTLWQGKQSRFKPDTGSKEYTDFAATVRAKLKEEEKDEPTDEEIEKAYTRWQFIQLYGTKKPSDKRQERMP